MWWHGNEDDVLHTNRGITIGSYEGSLTLCVLLPNLCGYKLGKVFLFPIGLRKPCSDYTLLVGATFFLSRVRPNVIDYTRKLKTVMRTENSLFELYENKFGASIRLSVYVPIMPNFTKKFHITVRPLITILFEDLAFHFAKMSMQNVLNQRRLFFQTILYWKMHYNITCK